MLVSVGPQAMLVFHESETSVKTLRYSANSPEHFYTLALFRSTFSYITFRLICRRVVHTAVLGLGGGGWFM
jgi:hypothetical protein